MNIGSMELSVDAYRHDQSIALAIELLFDGPDGWLGIAADHATAEHDDAIRLLVMAGLFEARHHIDAEAEGRWLRVHGWICGPVTPQEFKGRIRTILEHVGWASDGKLTTGVLFHVRPYHSLRRSKFGSKVRREGDRLAAVQSLRYAHARPPGQFKIEGHEFLQADERTGAVAVAGAAASATASVGDINVNIPASIDPEQLVAAFVKQLQSVQPPPAEMTVDEALRHPEPFKPHSESLRVITKAFEKHCRAMPGALHADKVKEWRRLHPNDSRTDKQLKRASERYPDKKPSKAE